VLGRLREKTRKKLRRRHERQNSHITGSTSGIGWVIAQALAAQGADILAVKPSLKAAPRLMETAPGVTVEHLLAKPEARLSISEQIQSWQRHRTGRRHGWIVPYSQYRTQTKSL